MDSLPSPPQKFFLTPQCKAANGDAALKPEVRHSDEIRHSEVHEEDSTSNIIVDFAFHGRSRFHTLLRSLLEEHERQVAALGGVGEESFRPSRTSRSNSRHNTWTSRGSHGESNHSEEANSTSTFNLPMAMRRPGKIPSLVSSKSDSCIRVRSPGVDTCSEALGFQSSVDSRGLWRNSSMKLNSFKPRKAWTEDNYVAKDSRKLSICRSRNGSLLAALERSHEVRHVASYANKFVLHPNSGKRLTWDFLSMLLLAYDVLAIPFISAFDPAESNFLEGMTWSTLVFWSVDMVLSFVTGFMKKNEVILRPSRIARNYLKGWFWLDGAVVGLDWTLVLLAEGSGGGSVARFGRGVRSLRFVRSLRLLRMMKLKKLVQTIQDQISTESLSICFGIIKVILSLLVANHLVACAWYGIGTIKDHRVPAGWVSRYNMKSRSLAYQYTSSLHWSLSQFTPAPNDISPQNIYERIFATGVIVIALVAFSSFVSTLTTAMVQLRNISSTESRQFWLLRRYLRDWSVRTKTQHRIIKYLEYAFQRQKARVQEKDVLLLSLLSQPLKEELHHETLRTHLFAHCLFFRCSDKIRVFSRALEMMSLAQGDVVFGCGEQASKMYFSESGSLAYYPGEIESESEVERSTKTMVDPIEVDVEPLYILHGDWISEPVLWTDWFHLGDFQADSECQVVAVHSAMFGELVRVSRPLWMLMQSYASKYIKHLNRYPKEKLTDHTQTLFDPVDLLGSMNLMDGSWQDSQHDEDAFVVAKCFAAIRWVYMKACGPRHATEPELPQTPQRSTRPSFYTAGTEYPEMAKPRIRISKESGSTLASNNASP